MLLGLKWGGSLTVYHSLSNKHHRKSCRFRISESSDNNPPFATDSWDGKLTTNINHQVTIGWYLVIIWYFLNWIFGQVGGFINIIYQPPGDFKIHPRRVSSSFPAAVASYLLLQLGVQYQATTGSMLLTNMFFFFARLRCVVDNCCCCFCVFRSSKIQVLPRWSNTCPRKMPFKFPENREKHFTESQLFGGLTCGHPSRRY